MIRIGKYAEDLEKSRIRIQSKCCKDVSSRPESLVSSLILVYEDMMCCDFESIHLQYASFAA